MLIRTILAVVFLANLFVYVWLSVNAPDELLPDMISGLLDDPVNGLEDAERRLELLASEKPKHQNLLVNWPGTDQCRSNHTFARVHHLDER